MTRDKINNDVLTLYLFTCFSVGAVAPRRTWLRRRRGGGSMFVRRLTSSGGCSLKRTTDWRRAVARCVTARALVLSTVASMELSRDRDLSIYDIANRWNVNTIKMHWRLSAKTKNENDERVFWETRGWALDRVHNSRRPLVWPWPLT